ncbi:MAG: MalY/PatB family protein [Desulfatirhabdiaceae bacterium]
MTLASRFRFDTAPDRRNTDSMKWHKYDGTDIIPMWVADMDFEAPPAVLEALHQRIAHGVLGYGIVPATLTAATIAMLGKTCSWEIDPDWLIWLPGLVTGLNVACRTIESQGIATATPIYPPFLTAPVYAGKQVVTIPMILDGATWRMDMDLLDQRLSSGVGLFLLCNPHNPTGRVFSAAELQAVMDICDRHDVVVCSDEIHCGLVLDEDKRHIPVASLSAAAASRTITLMAPSKTYNIPGLYGSFAVIPDPEIRRRFCRAMQGIVPRINVLAAAASEAAFCMAPDWHQELIAYLRLNRQRVMDAIAGMPGLSTTCPEATYLAWIDVRELGLDDPVRFFEEAGVGLSDGRDFGWEGFLRLNFGCPREILDKGLSRMADGIARL